MINISSDVDLQNKQAVRDLVDHEIGLLNQYLARSKMSPLHRMEAAMVREYLHAKLRGLIDNAQASDPNRPQDNAPNGD